MPLTIIEQYTSDEALSFELQGSLDSDTAP